MKRDIKGHANGRNFELFHIDNSLTIKWERKEGDKKKGWVESSYQYPISNKEAYSLITREKDYELRHKRSETIENQAFCRTFNVHYKLNRRFFWLGKLHYSRLITYFSSFKQYYGIAELMVY